jgi:hypothetical protein
MIVPAFVTHVCLGMPFAWSMMAAPLLLHDGGVAPAASDWSMAAVSAPMPLVFLCMGIASSTLGKWQMKVGVRHALVTASALFVCMYFFSSFFFLFFSFLFSAL